MSHIEIQIPIWRTRAFGIADFRLQGSGNIEVTCSYVDKNGVRLFPHTYTMSKSKARTYPHIRMGKNSGREIPIADWEVK